ncbi:MAG: hypothetical protein IJ677_05285 [Alphaproteobacteria bacterium]|jgi:hypothetical protein|nr:hypothetical protein [Alphaproteobacteria bacterium]
MAEDKSKIPASRIDLDTSPVAGSNKLITSGAVAQALDEVAEQIHQTDAEGNDISKTYAKIADVIFYEEMD